MLLNILSLHLEVIHELILFHCSFLNEHHRCHVLLFSPSIDCSLQPVLIEDSDHFLLFIFILRLLIIGIHVSSNLIECLLSTYFPYDPCQKMSRLATPLCEIPPVIEYVPQSICKMTILILLNEVHHQVLLQPVYMIIFFGNCTSIPVAPVSLSTAFV